MTRRSASSETASSTSAAPTSRAWSRTRLEARLGGLGDLGDVEDARGLLRLTGHVGVEWEGPVDLDDMDGDQLDVAALGERRDEADDPGVARAAVQGDHRAGEGGSVGLGHGRNDTTGRQG